MRNRIALLVAGTVVIALYGCASGNPGYSDSAKLVAQAPSGSAGGSSPASEFRIEARKAMKDIELGGEQAPSSDGVMSLASFTSTQRLDRYLIKNATVSIETKDARKSRDELMAAARVFGGYVGNLTESVDGLGTRTVTLQVRVPSKRFEQSMGDIEKLGKVLDKQITSDDVTEEFVDTSARVRNLKRTEERLLTHLSRTGKLSDTITVERELSRVRGEIESMEGRLRFLAHNVSFSTIGVTLTETPKAGPTTPVQTYSAGQEATSAIRSLVGFGQSALTTLLWIGVWAVVWGPIVVVAVFVIRKRRSLGAAHHS